MLTPEREAEMRERWQGKDASLMWAEIDRLRAELDAMRTTAQNNAQFSSDLLGEIEALREAGEGLAKGWQTRVEWEAALARWREVAEPNAEVYAETGGPC